MLSDVDLDAPSTTAAAGRGETLQHPSSSLTPLPRFASRRIQPLPLRGDTSHHFSVKRPRRNVAQRSIATLTNIGEDSATLHGIAKADKNYGSDDYPSHAPRVALALFCLVCSTGVYRGFSEFLIDRKATASTVTKNRLEGVDATPPFIRGSKDSEHREALLQGEGTHPQANFTDPTILLDENILSSGQESHLANIFHEQYNPHHNKLFIWHIPRSGANTIKHIASYCMGLTIASEAGTSEVPTGSNQELRIVEGMDGMHVAANVDLSNPSGIALAKTLHVGQSEKIDLVSSSYLWDLASVFDDPTIKGYMVAMFRHPIERATSLYYSMRRNKKYAKQVGSLSSVEQYAKSSLVENNWMTRFLSNTLAGELTPQHEAIAKEVLRTKCIIGLLRDKTETMRRLELLFNVKANKRSKKSEECQEKLLYWDWPGKNRHMPVVDGEAWDILYEQNTFDLRLYDYAKDLFEAQGTLFPSDRQ